jgi:hypothetical protein
MAVALTAIIISNAGQENSELSLALQELGYRTLLMLSSEDDPSENLEGMSDTRDLIIINLEAMDDPEFRRPRIRRLGTAVPVVVVLSPRRHRRRWIPARSASWVTGYSCVR